MADKKRFRVMVSVGGKVYRKTGEVTFLSARATLRALALHYEDIWVEEKTEIWRGGRGHATRYLRVK